MRDALGCCLSSSFVEVGREFASCRGSRKRRPVSTALNRQIERFQRAWSPTNRNLSTSAVACGTHQTLAFTRYCFTSRILCTNPSSYYCPPLLASLSTLLQYYCTTFAQYTTPPDPPCVCDTPYTILVITISCEGQIKQRCVGSIHQRSVYGSGTDRRAPWPEEHIQQRYIHVCVYTYRYIYVCVYICIYIYLYICVCVCVYICISLHTYILIINQSTIHQRSVYGGNVASLRSIVESEDGLAT